MTRKRTSFWDDVEDLAMVEAGLDEDGLDYWILFGDRERKEREARRRKSGGLLSLLFGGGGAAKPPACKKSVYTLKKSR